MAFEFRFPDVGEGLSEGKLVTWKIKVGDTIKEDDPLCDVETAKALVEVPSPQGGTILQLHAKEGDTIHVGEVLVTIGDAGEKVSAPVKKEAPKKVEAPKQEEKKEEPKVEEVAEKPPVQEVKKEVVAEKKEVKQDMTIKALPAARLKAKKMGVDLSSLQGTGKDGVITVADVVTDKKSGPRLDKKPSAPTVGFDKFGRTMVMPLSGVRRTIAQNMIASVSTIPHVTHVDEADVTALNELRKKKKDYADNKGIHLTMLPFIIKAAVSTLKKYRYLNATFDDKKQAMVIKEYYNIGFAVDTPHGLYVPVIKGVDSMSVLEIATHLFALAMHAKQRDLPIKDMQGASFTLTNIGSYGGVAATPIIPPGTAGILGLYRMRDKPVVKDGAIVVRKVMPLSITFDHRIVDGGYAARFMNDLIKRLEDPELLLLD